MDVSKRQYKNDMSITTVICTEIFLTQINTVDCAGKITAAMLLTKPMNDDRLDKHKRMYDINAMSPEVEIETTAEPLSTLPVGPVPVQT